VQLSYELVGSGAGSGNYSQTRGVRRRPITTDLGRSQRSATAAVSGRPLAASWPVTISSGHHQSTKCDRRATGTALPWSTSKVERRCPSAELTPKLRCRIPHHSRVPKRPVRQPRALDRHLSRSSPEWQSNVGVSLTPNWPPEWGVPAMMGSLESRAPFLDRYVEYFTPAA